MKTTDRENKISLKTRIHFGTFINRTFHKTTCEISFIDNGPGIPRDKRNEVVLPFTRLENSRNIKTGGTGLGLSIAKNSALNQGGELILEDSPLGGLRVRLLLPL